MCLHCGGSAVLWDFCMCPSLWVHHPLCPGFLVFQLSLSRLPQAWDFRQACVYLSLSSDFNPPEVTLPLQSGCCIPAPRLGFQSCIPWVFSLTTVRSSHLLLFYHMGPALACQRSALLWDRQEAQEQSGCSTGACSVGASKGSPVFTQGFGTQWC